MQDWFISRVLKRWILKVFIRLLKNCSYENTNLQRSLVPHFLWGYSQIIFQAGSLHYWAQAKLCPALARISAPVFQAQVGVRCLHLTQFRVTLWFGRFIHRMWCLPSLVFSLSFLSFLSYFIFLFSSCCGSSNPCLLVQEVREQDAYPGLISTLGTNYSLLSAESS